MGAWPGIASFARTASLRYTPGAVAKPRYTQAQVIEALTQSTGFISVAARTLGCSSDTVENYVKKYPAVAEAKRAAREVILDKAESALLKKVEDGDVHAIMFTLKTIGKHRGACRDHWRRWRTYCRRRRHHCKRSTRWQVG
jgi:hypothetical protein